MITTVRDFLIAELGGSTFMWDVFLGAARPHGGDRAPRLHGELGGSTFMWDVFLGVLLAIAVIVLVQFLIWIVTRPFR